MHAWPVRVLLPVLFAIASLLSTNCAHGATRTIVRSGGTIQVSLPDESPDVLSQDDLMNWVQRAVDAVSTYYGRFPAKHLSLHIRADDRKGVHHGETFPSGAEGGMIEISVGRHTAKSDLESDWMLTHEMIHLAFPDMPRQQHWIEEGLSVYVEPVARVQAGQLPVEEMWYETVRDMHQGEPQPGDEGLDHTHSWGRTYWGGAMFCLMADVAIREQTHNRKGLQDALRGILDEGGMITKDWDIERAFEIGDQATGTHVLMQQYRNMSGSADPVDLANLWKKLGLTVEGQTVKLERNAPDAAIRDAITRKRD